MVDSEHGMRVSSITYIRSPSASGPEEVMKHQARDDYGIDPKWKRLHDGGMLKFLKTCRLSALIKLLI